MDKVDGKDVNNFEIIDIDTNGDSKSITLKVNNSNILDNLIKPKSLGVGSVMNRYDPISRNIYYPYTSTNTPYSTAIELPTDPHEQMALAMTLYYNDPIVGTVVDLMTDICTSGFENECNDPKIKKFYDNWCKKVNMEEVIQWIFLEYFRTGNVTIYKSMNEPKNMNKRGRKSSNLKGKRYPSGYTVLNPLLVVIEGPLLFNQEVVSIKVTEELRRMILYPKDEEKVLLEMIPTEIIKGVRAGKTAVPLDQKLVSRITRKKQPYERYAVPGIHRCFEPCLYKQKLRKMDISTIEGLVNQLITVTIGDKDFPADDKQLKAVAELFKTPSKAYTIFWNHTLQVKFHRPEGIETLDQDKYKQVNDDILMGLGITRVLLDGQGSNFSTAWVSILALLNRLEGARKQVARWLESEYEQIAEDNGFSTYPRVRFNKLSLREDAYVKNVILAMYDRGLLSAETVLTDTGYKIDIEKERKKAEKKDADLFIPPELPYTRSGGQPGPSNQGRPSSPGKNDYTPREVNSDPGGNPPKPRSAKANLTNEEASVFIDYYESELNDAYEQTRQKVLDIASSEDDEDRKKELIFLSFLSFSILFNRAGEVVMSEVYDLAYRRNSGNMEDSIYISKKEFIKDWHNKYTNKFAGDLSKELLEADGLGVDFINSVFDSNLYRIKMFAREGVMMANMQGQIAANQSIGKTKVIWKSALTENTCEICMLRHNKVYDIDEVPIDHPNGHCWLEFID